MTVVRPVAKRLPSSFELLEKSSLPLSCVVTPFAHAKSLETNNHNTICANAPPLTSIPKCLHCGAPHPSKTSYYSMGGYDLICKLCHQKSSARFRDQQEFRMLEQMDPKLYNNNPNTTPIGSSNANKKQTHECSLPLWNHDNETVLSTPAMSCPPVWWIVVDGTSKSRTYWNATENSLAFALDKESNCIPPHVHVGLIVINATSLGVWDLSSPVPHVRHHSTICASQQQEKGEEDLLSCLGLSLVPADALHLPNIQAALRALGDCTTVLHDSDDKHHVYQQSHYRKRRNRPSLGLVLEVILDFMSRAHHPGQNDTTSGITYAGGKILCFLSGPTQETETVVPTSVSSSFSNYIGDIGTGGFGGCCAPYGIRYTKEKIEEENESSRAETDPTDMTPTNLAKQFPRGSKDCHRYYQDLGTACAHAALGVDVLILADDSPLASKVIGVPYLRALADKSGAPGPMLFAFNSDKSQLLDKEGLKREVLSRTPWYRPMAFGALFRVRLSPGLVMDKTNPVQDDEEHLLGSKTEKGPNLAATYGCGGLTGPASLAAESKEDKNDRNDDMLWTMGACDDTTTVTLDFDIVGELRDQIYLDGFGEVVLKPCLQICFAYTTIQKNEHGEWVTVRRIRVTTLAMVVAYDTETLYASLDPEALATALFHKLTVTSLRDGLMEAQVAGQLWLVSLLVCVYRSAKRHAARLDAQAGHGLGAENNTTFYPHERLLDQNDGGGGQLSTKDVLLGQGHERLSAIPFMLFALLQCDALRPSQGSYQPTMDARCAASAQMFSMTPSVLSRCVAPTLELWSCGENARAPVVAHVDLSLERLEFVVVDHQLDNTTEPKSSDVIVVVDSPRQIMVYNGQRLRGSKRPLRDLSLSGGLRRCVEDACLSYRVPPPVVHALSQQDRDNHSETEPNGAVSESQLLSDALVEDSTTVDGLGNFQQWRSEIATLVHEELLKESI